MQARRLFGTSGIRGVVSKELSPAFCRQVGQAMGSTLPPASAVCVATDTRISRDTVKEAVTEGLLSSGINVVDLGILPTPALALLTRELGFTAGVMITASHNPPEFNGIKLFNGNSLGYSQAQEAEVERLYFQRKFRQGKKGTLEQGRNMKEKYLSFIKEHLREPDFSCQLKVVVDPGNGAASKFATDILVDMGFNVIPVNDEPDGLFPNRSPEPKDDTLQGTIDFLRQHGADLAVCFDGDADRVVFCDRRGFLGFNEPIAFISRLVVKKTGRGKIATTVETGLLLDLAVKDLGAQVVRGRVGDVSVAHLAQEVNAALGVEHVGVYIFPEIGYYPDSIFASLLLLSQLRDASELREFFQTIPRLFFQKAKVPCPNELKELVMGQVMENAHLLALDQIPVRSETIDGLRLEFPDSWILIRASGTEPAIRIISESTSRTDTDELLQRGEKLVQTLVEANK
ncbi:MAG: phosphoglucosamine mutase [Dehalococcoidia bacterium]